MTVPPITLDLLIFLAFLVLNIIVGIKYRGKSKSFIEYAIGDKKFPTPILTATIVATLLAGSTLFIGLQETYSKGLYFAITLLLGVPTGLLIIGHVIGPRMGKFLNNLSVPDVLGSLYGKPVQVIAGISTVLQGIGFVAVQFKVISNILSILFSYDGSEVTIIASSIVILYAASGGVKAVTFTDVLQFLTFGSFLALTIWHNIPDHSQVALMLTTNPLFNFNEVLKWSPELMGTIALMAYFIFPDLPPQLFQRIAMARDTEQVKRSMTWSALMCLGFNLFIMWIAIFLLTEKPGLAPNQVVPYMISSTHAYPGLKGFLCIGVMAMAMSTADSILNASSVIIANDILAPLHSKKVNSLKIARWATIGIGFSALLLALRVERLLGVLLQTANVYMPIVVIPMLLAVFGFQTSRRVVLMAMAAGALTVVIYLFVYKSTTNSLFPGMLANLVVLLGAHYLLGEKGGWGHNPIQRNPYSYLKT